MCGICGIIHDDPSRPVDRDILVRMNETMAHRGPDDAGTWFGRGAALAMRRLAILDVASGQQPMSCEHGHVHSVINGEIYNYIELADRLRARNHRLQTHCDAEVVPHLYEEYRERLLEKIDGMFGLAVWDERERTLLLARDRLGEKPLYWTYTKGVFLFASELKALLVHPQVARRLDRASFARYLTQEYVPAPHTIFEGIHKLEPGKLLLFHAGSISVQRYWDVPRDGTLESISTPDAVAEIRRLLRQSVRERMMSDVPLGVFLSGGIDSSSVVAMMAQEVEPASIKTFSIGFSERSFDESSYARRVARHFGTDHLEHVCTPGDLMELMPKVLDFLDEPFADASIIPTAALSSFTRERVTVALGGDGGDELFAGYPTFQAERLAGVFAHVPRLVREGIFEPLVRRLPVSRRNISLDFKLKQFLRGASFPPAERHQRWMGAFTVEELDALLIQPRVCDPYDLARRHLERFGSTQGNALLYLYLKMYLAEDLLTKVDRASMGASLEVRAPFLDHHLVEFVSHLPYRLKLAGWELKHVLKEAMREFLPRGIADRPKKGFGIPVAQWISGPLKALVRETLSPERLRESGLFNPSVVENLLEEHWERRADHRKKLWTLFLFEQWRRRWMAGRLQ